jgi:branched-chain amino acid transport system permease protein
MPRTQKIALGVMAAFFLLAPLVVYPVFLMKAMCFALFACAFNLLIGFGGLLSFGHAMFLGTAGCRGAFGQDLGLPAGIGRSCSAPPAPRCWAW